MQKGQVQIILIGVLVIAVLVGGAYYLGRQTNPKQSPAPEVSYQTPQPTQQPLVDTFQGILNKYCKKIDIGLGAFFYGMQPENLPVSIDASIIKIKPRGQGAVPCMIAPPSSSYVFVEFGEEKVKNIINIYDKNSKEDGHGGPPYLGVYGQIIKDTENLKLTAYINWPEAGYPLPGDLSVSVRGEKRLQLSNGETVYINISKIAINEDDPRLVIFFEDRTQSSKDAPSGREIIYRGADEEMVEQFFSDLSKLGSPEKENIAEIEMILEAVTAK